MAFAKLSGSLLESDARPARTEQQPVPAPGVEGRVAPALAARDILERLASLTEAAPLYDSLWEFIRTDDKEGVARLVAELVRAGRSVSEISEIVQSLSQLRESAGPEPSERFADDLLQPDASGEVTEAPPDPGPDDIAASWATDREPEPAINTPYQTADDTATWREPTESSEEPTESSEEPAIVADAEAYSGGGAIRELITSIPPEMTVRRPLSAPTYVGAALAVVVAIAGGGVLLFSQPAVKEVGAATAHPANAGATLAANPAAMRADDVGRPAGGPPAADSKAARPSELAMAPPVSPPVPASPVLAAAAVPAAPVIAQPETKPAATTPAPPENTARSVVPGPTIAAPATSSHPTALAGTTDSGGDRPQAKPAAGEPEGKVKAASTVPAPPEQPAVTAPAPAPAAAPTPPDRAASDGEASAVVASLEPAKAIPAALPPSHPAPPTGAPRSTTVEPTDPPAAAADTAPLLERGDRLFGTGDIASARLFYERAADAGNGQAALRLGETYDPAFLQRAQLRVAGDRGLAVFWYGRARELGADEADILLKGMQSR